jgi:hypothetical protein
MTDDRSDEETDDPLKADESALGRSRSPLLALR